MTFPDRLPPLYATLGTTLLLSLLELFPSYARFTRHATLGRHHLGIKEYTGVKLPVVVMRQILQRKSTPKKYLVHCREEGRFRRDLSLRTM